MPLASGSSLGSYTIVAPLGTGGMGEVYRAHDPRLGRDVALKVLPADMAKDPSRLERFTREARAIAALNHPHIVTIYSTEEADGIRFLTMELVEGQPLDALIPANGMPLARFLELAVPLADALSAAHQKQITHRDLKPANVMVARDGRVKVLDFGLASAPSRHLGMDSLVTSPQVTTPGTIIGTMPYMSPEQVEGKQLDHRTDLFSLGVMFHEMLAGTRPFSGESSPQLMSAILRDTPSSTSDLRGDVPEPLSRLVARCLEKQPDDRVQTARDIYNELRHLQKQLESGPRPRPDSGPARAAPAGDTWIAVIPFTSVATDEDARTLADGLTEDITAGLARFPYLSVVAEHSARQHKGTTADVRQIGKVLGARYILDGGLRRGGTSIRITARLVDAGSGAQLWSEAYTRDLAQGHLLTIQDDVTDRVVATVADVHGVLMRSASVGVHGVPIDRLAPEALRLRYWSYHRQHAPIEHGLLRDHFEGLVKAQPAVAPFWAVLAHLCLHEYGFGFNARPDPLLRARHAVDRALELDSLNQHAWEALAFTVFFEQDREGFAHAADRVLALNPRNANATALMGILFVHAGDLERGCALADRASAINPDHPGWYHIARASADYASGRFESALRSAKRINMPQHLWAHALVAMASAQLGRTAEALVALETLLGLEPAFGEEAAMAAATRRWKWLPEQSEQMLDGYRKAMALRREAANPRPHSDAVVSAAAAGVAVPREVPPVSTTRPSDARPGAIDMSVTVRPLTVRAGDDEAAELADGLVERITTGLSRFAYLRVRAASGRDVVARQPAGAGAVTSGARFAVEGGVKRGGRAVRVNVRLLEVASDTTLWAEQYDRDGSVDAFTIQDEIGDRVVATLADEGGALYRLFAAAVNTTADEKHDASRLFVRLAQFVEHFTREEHGRLRDQYEALVERQASNATAWAHLAILYGLEVFFGFNPLPDPVARVRRAAERAVACDPTDQGAWYALADAAFLERNAAAFRSAADRTIEINPLRSRTVGAIGLLRAFAGDAAEGAALVARAISQNPRHPGWFHIALFLDAFQRGDADHALGEAARINMPHVPVDGKLFAIAAAGRFGRAREAAAAIEELRRDYPHLLDARRAREQWAIRIWSGELLDSLVDGFEAALNAQSAAQPASAAGTGSSPAAAAPVMPVTSPTLTGDLAVAVRLFSSRGGESADALAEGLTDDVAAGLSRFSYLRVVPRALAEATLSPARYVLEGQVRRAHPHLRISARLNDTVSGATLWAESFDRGADTDPFRLQDEVAPRIIATIADANGGLLRSMVATLKQRPIEEHTVSELVVRFHGFLEHFDPVEHAMIRDRLAAALRKEPAHADGWACLSSLVEHEVSQDLNPQPESLKRAREFAERSIAADPVCQQGWLMMTSAAFAARDATGVRVAAERAIAINPLNTRTVAGCGMFLAYSGAWDRGLEVLRQAMEPNPHYPRWLHFPFFSYHYSRREYAEAFEQTKQINMPRFPKLYLCLAAAAGQLGLRDDARRALEALLRLDASSHDDGYVRRAFTFWHWREEDIDHHVEGVRKARALVAGETGESPRTPSRASIAVLPFADLSAEKNQDWLCDGIAEEILNALAHLPGLRVAGRTSSFSFRDRDDAAKAIAERLGVSSVLEGSVRRAGDRVRVTVQLVDPANGFQLWSERYDRELKDIFAIQDEIARSVGAHLKVALDSGMERRLIAAQTSNIEAYELYLKGRMLLSRRGASILPALDHFRRAVELDPDYAPAWAGIADAYVVCGYFGLLPGSEVRRQGPAAARRALLLDPNSADAFSALAVLQQMCENDVDAAGAAFRKALELNPACVQARCWYAIFFLQSALGKFEEGVAEARYAKELDPLSAYTTAILSAALVNAGCAAEGVEEARKAMAIDPESFLARWILGRALFYDNQLDEALSVLEQAAAMSGRHHFTVVTLAKTHAKKGQRDRARVLHEELVQRSGTMTVPAAELMLTADAAGDREQALVYASQALENRDPSFILLVRHWVDSAELRQDARFVSLIRTLDAANAGATDQAV